MNNLEHSTERGTRSLHSTGGTRTVLGLLCFLGLPALACPPKLYTTTAQWNAGVRFNTIGVNDAADGRLQLVDPGEIRTFPTLWPANAGEDTVSKFDTNLNKEIGRYRTWFDIGLHGEFSGPAPSRTAVDASGNVYVVNRHFDGRSIFVMKIMTSDTGADDRDGNGTIDTATDLNNNGVVTGAEILSVVDDGGVSAGSPGGGAIAGDGIPQVREFHDERIKWCTVIPSTAGQLGRACAIAPDGNIWVGSYNGRAYYRLNGATGAIMAGPVPTPAITPYGAVIDSAGTLWSASLSTALGRLDTNVPAYVSTHFSAYNNYGIALDESRRRVYLGYGPPYSVFDTTSLTFSYPVSGTHTYGISTASNGDILVHGSNSGYANVVSPGTAFSGYGATRFRPDHSVAWSSGYQAGAVDSGSRGIAPDANGDVFTINLDTGNVSKYRGSDGAHLGVFPIGARPYSYSDLSGSSFLQTNLVGTWVAEHSDTLRGNKKCVVTWNATGPGTVKVEIAGSNTAGSPGPFVLVTSGVEVPGVAGKYITTRITLQAAAQVSPAVQDLTLNTCPQIGDFDDNCCVDMADYNLMRAAYNARSTDPRWDVNGDGVFNINDLRKEVLLFCYPNGLDCSCCPAS